MTLQQQFDQQVTDSITNNKEQWLARALQRNPNVAALFERLRPVSLQQTATCAVQHKQQEENFGKWFDNSHLVSRTEDVNTLSREQMIQLIYQHLHTKKYAHAMRVLQEETGIACMIYECHIYFLDNGVGKKQASFLRALLQANPACVQHPSKEVLLTEEDANEVQTNSCKMHHLEPEHVREWNNNIWTELRSVKSEDECIMWNDDGTVRAASLNKLIEILTNEKNDMNFCRAFLATYRSFTVPEVLLEKLIQRFHVPKLPLDPFMLPDVWADIAFRIQLRTVNVIDKWLQSYFKLDWNYAMVQKLIAFLDRDVSKSAYCAKCMFIMY